MLDCRAWLNTFCKFLLKTLKAQLNAKVITHFFIQGYSASFSQSNLYLLENISKQELCSVCPECFTKVIWTIFLEPLKSQGITTSITWRGDFTSSGGESALGPWGSNPGTHTHTPSIWNRPLSWECMVCRQHDQNKEVIHPWPKGSGRPKPLYKHCKYTSVYLTPNLKNCHSITF